MKIIVDKSWIQGVKRENLKEVCINYDLLLPSTLGYEIFTSKSRDEMKIILNKLDVVRDKVFLLKDLYAFLEYEIEHQKPFSSFNSFYEDISFGINVENMDSEFDVGQKFILNRYKNYLEVEGPKELLEICEGVDNYFPKLKSGRNSNAVDFDNAINEVCNNLDLLKEIYNDIRSTNFPSKKIVNYDWAIIRKLQLLLLYGIEYKKKYDEVNRINKNTLAHDNIDIEYLILGVLNKCIGTNDNKMKYIFNIACKGGKLFGIK